MAFVSNDPKKNQQVVNSQVLGPGGNAASQQAQDAMLAQQDKASPIPSQAPQVTRPRTPSAPKSASSGTFVNVQDYIDKNKQSAQRMGEAVQQNVQSAADIARKNIEQTQGKFSTEVERGSLQGRDTAVEEAKKVALAAAGGVQEQVEAKPQDYSQQLSDLEKQQAEYNKSLEAQRKGQQEFQQFQNAQKQIGNLSSFLKDYAAAWNPGAMANYNSVARRQQDDLRKKQAELTKTFGNLDKFVQTHSGGLSLYQPGKTGFVDRILKESSLAKDPIYAEALKGYLESSKQTANTDPNRFISQPLTNPKYFDRSAEIKDLENKTKMAGEDIKMYQELAAVVPPQQLVPEMLQKAAEFDGEVSEDRFREIINAVYGGPQRLSQIKGYEDTVGKVSEADRRLALINRAGVSGDLLRTAFQSPGRTYTRGQEQLDQLLMGQGDTLKNLLSAKQEIGKVGDTLSQAQQAAMSEAATRQQEIEDIRTGARSNVQGIAEARAGQVDDRLSQVIEGWDTLPQYFRDALTKNIANNKGYDVSALESQLLGVKEGEGLYNAIKDQGIENVIRATKADRNKLISQREFGNLQNLQRLAEMADDYGVPGSDLTFKSGFQDEALAGTQTAMDALDTENLRNILNTREDQFGQAANKKITGTGVGHDRYKSGFKSRDVWERVNLDTNLKQALAKAGYKFDRPSEENLANPEIAQQLAQYIQGESAPSWDKNMQTKLDLTDPQSYASSWGGLFTGDALTGIPIGSSVGQFATNLVNSLANKLPGGTGGLFGSLFGSGKANAYNTARTNAQRAAQADLANNIRKELEKQGFGNRFDIDESSQAVRDRRAALMKILGQTDLTNITPQTGAYGEIFSEEQPFDPMQYIRSLGSNLR